MALTEEKRKKLDAIFSRTETTTPASDVEGRISRLRSIAGKAERMPEGYRPEGVVQYERPIGPEPAPISTRERLRDVSAIDVAKKTAGFYGDVLTGGLKGAAKTVAGIATLPQLAGRFAAEKITGKPAPEEFKTVREMLDKKGALEAKGEVQKGAMAGEQLAEFVAPGGFLTKLTKGRFLSRILAEGATFGGITAAQRGEVGREAGTAALIGGAIPAVGTGLRIAKKVISPQKNIDELVGQIIQGKAKDIQGAKKALSILDTKGVKTYDQLSGKINQKIDILANKLDNLLDIKEDTTLLKDLSTKIKVGEKIVSSNYVDDALKQLDELYKKTNDPVTKETVAMVKRKAISEGLTVKSINDLARHYGNEFSSKAFSKVTGEPLTSVNAQVFENTRRGLKNLARKLYDGEEFKIIDSEMSKLIRVRELSDKMIEKSNTLRQKIGERGLGEKAGRALFNMIDILSGKTVSGFMRAGFVPRGGGLKTFNALDLERSLQKNLNKLDKLEKIIMQKRTGILSSISKRVFGE